MNILVYCDVLIGLLGLGICISGFQMAHDRLTDREGGCHVRQIAIVEEELVVGAVHKAPHVLEVQERYLQG